MNLKDLKCIIVTEGNINTSKFSFDKGSYTSLFPGLKLEIKRSSNILNIQLVNESKKLIHINSLEIQLSSYKASDYESYILNPENPREKISIKNIKKDTKDTSFLFGALVAKERLSSWFAGFLGSCFSKNSIKISVSGDNINVYAVYDFVAHGLEGGEKLILDSINFESGNRYLQLINKYVSKINEINPLAKRDHSNIIEIKDSYLLFSEYDNSETLKAEGKSLSIKAKGHRLYPVNIALESIQSSIINKLQGFSESGQSIVHIKEVYAYLKEAEKARLFNAYYEFNRLLLMINYQFPNIQLCFDDCPLGLISGKNAIIKQELDLSIKTKIVDKLIGHSTSSIADNFMIRTILQRLAAGHSTKYNINKKSIKDLLDVITGNLNYSSSSIEIFNDLRKDIAEGNEVIPYPYKENIFSFLAKGKEAIYIAAFNLTNKPTRFFLDLSMDVENHAFDGSAVELFTNECILISSSKIYIKNLPSMDFRLIQKILIDDKITIES